MRRIISNKLFTIFLCLALVFKVLVPVGYMPDFNALQHGTLRITMCTGHGPVDLADWKSEHGSTNDSHNNGKHESHNDTLCSFGANANLLANVIPAPQLVALLTGFVFLSFMRAYRQRYSRIYANASPRSPPIFS